MASTAVVRLIEHVASAIACDPEHCYEYAMVQESLARIRAGESTVNEEFGPGMTRDELDDMLDRYIAEHGRARRYRLPDHWHWMGER